MPRDPKFWLADSKFRGEFEYELRSGFRARIGELKRASVFGMEGDSSSFRDARPNRTSYSDPTYPKHHTYLGAHGFIWVD